jgi:hypothetical protein
MRTLFPPTTQTQSILAGGVGHIVPAGHCGNQVDASVNLTDATLCTSLAAPVTSTGMSLG